MLFISRGYGDGTYGVTDTSNSIEERYSLEELKGYLDQGTFKMVYVR